MSDELRKYYKAKTKKPQLYSYDDDGNLIELNKEGTVIKTIPLPIYRSPTYEEFDEMETKRMNAIAIANKEYEDLRTKLRSTILKPDVTDSEIVRLNRKVIEADIKLQNVRFPLKNINYEVGVEIREIDFNQPSETRKYPYDIAILETRPFSLQEQYVRIGSVQKKPLISVAEANAYKESIMDVPLIIFSEPETNDYGFLSLKWTVDIEYNGVLYNSAQQAIYAEIAKEFNDNDNLNRIMLAESPNEVKYSLDMIPGDSEVNEPKWNDLIKKLLYDINIAKFKQFSELKARLLATKNAVLGAYIQDNMLMGIGISIDNIQSKNPNNWTGQNLLGKTLMDIRSKLYAEQLMAEQQVAAMPTESKVRKRKKVAPSIAPVSEKETDDTAPVPSAAIAPVPRPIRRKPVIAPQ
jgi:ribA/ribD-fused uncharacterized protein